MGRNIKHRDLINLTKDKEMIKIINKIYEGRIENGIISSCGFGSEVNRLNIEEEMKIKFMDFVRSNIDKIEN
jgi:hypothetical protein